MTLVSCHTTLGVFNQLSLGRRLLLSNNRLTSESLTSSIKGSSFKLHQGETPCTKLIIAPILTIPTIILLRVKIRCVLLIFEIAFVRFRRFFEFLC